MENAGEYFADISFSANDLPGHNRSAAIRENMSEMMRVEIEMADANAPIRFNSTIRAMPGTVWATVHASAMSTARTRQLVKDAEDDLALMVYKTDVLLKVAGREDVYVAAGDAVLLSRAREITVAMREASTVWALKVPHKEIARLLPQIGSAPVLTIRRDCPMLSLLGRYGRLLDGDPMADAQSRSLVGRHLREMMALAIGQSPDFLTDVASNTVASVRFRTAQAEIAKHFSDRTISLEWLAAELRITPRHLTRLFARNGTSFHDELWRARLTCARAMLEDPCHAHRTISAIALECGFPEASVLNRHFRREYGMTPGEVRPRSGMPGPAGEDCSGAGSRA